MTIASDAPRDGFRLGMLIYDTRYRSMTIQIVVLLLFMAGAAWLVDNVIRNLQTLGKDFSFDFLWQRSGYDIKQTLIPYTNDSTHGRAMFVGLLNTILVSVMGCVAATIIGVVVGILRLSRNWIVARIMTVYVETFRNIPLLLWIYVIFAVFTEITPAPNAFRVSDEMIAAGEKPAATMDLFNSIAITNRGTYVPMPEVSRSLGSVEVLTVPVSLNVLAFLAAVAAGVFLHRSIQKSAKRVQEASGVRPVTWWKSALALFLPPVALLVALGFNLSYPKLAGFNFQGGINVSNALMALWLSLSLYTAAFIAEIVRAGIVAISKGQSEASFALGLRPGVTMRLVILPQALRVIIPPLISQFLNLTKNSSLAIAVSYLDLRGTLGGITLNQTGRELECILLMMLIYLALSLMISGVMNIYNNAVKLKER